MVFHPPLKFNLRITENDITLSKTNIVDGDIITISANVTNVGGRAATGFYVRFKIGELSTDISVPGLQINAYYIASTTWNATLGNHTLQVELDPDEPLIESTLEDNFVEIPITVTEKETIDDTKSDANTNSDEEFNLLPILMLIIVVIIVILILFLVFRKRKQNQDVLGSYSDDRVIDLDLDGSTSVAGPPLGPLDAAQELPAHEIAEPAAEPSLEPEPAADWPLEEIMPEEEPQTQNEPVEEAVVGYEIVPEDVTTGIEDEPNLYLQQAEIVNDSVTEPEQPYQSVVTVPVVEPEQIPAQKPTQTQLLQQPEQLLLPPQPPQPPPQPQRPRPPRPPQPPWGR